MALVPTSTSSSWPGSARPSCSACAPGGTFCALSNARLLVCEQSRNKHVSNTNIVIACLYGLHLCREQNEFDFAQRQEGISDLERRRLAAEAVKEAAKEEEFHLKQSIDRARKRLRESRGHPIDELIQVPHLLAEFPIQESAWRPYHVFEAMRLEEVQQLLEQTHIFKVRVLSTILTAAGAHKAGFTVHTFPAMHPQATGHSMH